MGDALPMLYPAHSRPDKASRLTFCEPRGRLNVVTTARTISPKRAAAMVFVATCLTIGRAYSDEFKLETVHLKDSRVFSGLVDAERQSEIDFAEIVRQPGKPMYAVVRPIDKKAIARVNRLPEEERRVLIERLRAFRNRAQIEAGRIEDVSLTEVQRGGETWLAYDGNWFTLYSTADAQLTRRCVVRVEQIFRAYRQLLPPRTNPKQKLEMVLFDSFNEYRDDLARRKLEIENPAFFSPPLNLILAGSDLAHFAAELSRVRGQNENTRRHYESLQADFNKRLAKTADELKRNGYTRDEIADELRLRKRTWEDEHKARLAEIAEANRRNEALFDEVTRRMFVRLYHEAFHAYLENFVYPGGDSAMPRWLNEGLAQVFETAQLDGDLLRIDAPSRTALSALQADLAGEPLPLAELLTAKQESFLATHAGGASQRNYLYSWGLAYYLAFHQNLLGGAALEKYLSAESAELSPIARFEQLCGQPLADFERAWRSDMRTLKLPAK